MTPLDIQPDQWQQVLSHLFNRYENVIMVTKDALEDTIGSSLTHRALALCGHAQVHIQEISEDKANRWLGFVQGVLVVADVIDIETERDYTRPLFHALHGPSVSHDVR